MIGYFFIPFLILIAAPLIFWLGSLLFVWVKWLFNDKEQLNESYSYIHDIINPVSDSYTIKYKIGTDSKVKLFILNTKFEELKKLFEEDKIIGNHNYDFNSKDISNGTYFVKMVTANQTMTKKIIVAN
ncbi:MAG: T9SS type A sorting domain-containing protein [Flavobacteriales bacterium]